LLSLSSLASRQRPCRRLAASANTGAKPRQGPHQSAQTSTSSGRAPLFWPTKLAWVSSKGSLPSRAPLQRPQRGASVRRSAGIRLSPLQCGQGTSSGSLMAVPPEIDRSKLVPPLGEFKRAAPAGSDLGSLQRLGEVGKDVVDVLDADRQADQILRYAGLEQLLLVQLAVGGGRRVA